MVTKQDNKKTKYFSLTRSVLWAVMIPVAFFFGWIYSVAFVSTISLYANAASDFAAYRADDNPQLTRIEEKLDKLIALWSDSH